MEIARINYGGNIRENLAAPPSPPEVEPSSTSGVE